MKKVQLYLLAFVIAAVGLSGAFYKWQVLSFPLTPNKEVEVWTVQARAEFDTNGRANTVMLQIPNRTPGSQPFFGIIEETFISRGYGQNIDKDRGGRAVEWTIRRDSAKPRVLYYRATIVRDQNYSEGSTIPRVAARPELDEPEQAALNTIFETVKSESADIASFARAFVRRFTGDMDDDARLLLGAADSAEDRAKFVIGALGIRNIPARIIHGFVLGDPSSGATLKPYVQVHNEEKWITLDIETAAVGLPEDFLVWSTSERPTLEVGSDKRPMLEFSVQRNLSDAIAMAKRRTEVRDEALIRYSLLSLPLDKQALYQILLMVPVGAFVMLILRNIIGLKSFGTFMPVLVALAFAHTDLLSGVLLFTLVVTLGLLARFVMEKLKLLLVPRLTAVLILVILLMCMVSVVSHQLNLEVGLSIALFPMVIMTMTIERLSIAWDERGPTYAIKQGVGSLIVAILCYFVMAWPALKHLIFVFPELLLVLFAMTLLLGRYSGYRLTELFRFGPLAVDTAIRAAPIAAPNAAPIASGGAPADSGPSASGAHKESP